VPRLSDRAGPTSSSRKRHQQYCLPPVMRTSAPRSSLSFRGSITQPAHPLSTLRCALTEHQRMTRGHRDSLSLRCRAFSSPSPCRFIPALSITCQTRICSSDLSPDAGTAPTLRPIQRPRSDLARSACCGAARGVTEPGALGARRRRRARFVTSAAERTAAMKERSGRRLRPSARALSGP
jgi:hypothetical protein